MWLIGRVTGEDRASACWCVDLHMLDNIQWRNLAAGSYSNNRGEWKWRTRTSLLSQASADESLSGAGDAKPDSTDGFCAPESLLQKLLVRRETTSLLQQFFLLLFIDAHYSYEMSKSSPVETGAAKFSSEAQDSFFSPGRPL